VKTTWKPNCRGLRLSGAETVAGRLAIDTQADLIADILRLTLPAGLGHFVEKLTALGGILGAAPSATALASRSPKPSTL
jgi:hypothetical protein